MKAAEVVNRRISHAYHRCRREGLILNTQRLTGHVLEDLAAAVPGRYVVYDTEDGTLHGLEQPTRQTVGLDESPQIITGEWVGGEVVRWVEQTSPEPRGVPLFRLVDPQPESDKKETTQP